MAAPSASRPKGAGQDDIASHTGRDHDGSPGRQSSSRANAIASRGEWETIARTWPLKRLVAIWNALPGVTPVEKFTSKQIALERIWRAIESPERAHGESARQTRADQSPIPRRLESSPGVCPALPAGRSDGARDPGPHRLAAAQCAGFPFGKRTQAGAERACVRTPGRARVPRQELSQVRQLGAPTSRPRKGAEEFFLLLPIEHAGDRP